MPSAPRPTYLHARGPVKLRSEASPRQLWRQRSQRSKAKADALSRLTHLLQDRKNAPEALSFPPLVSRPLWGLSGPSPLSLSRQSSRGGVKAAARHGWRGRARALARRERPRENSIVGPRAGYTGPRGPGSAAPAHIDYRHLIVGHQAKRRGVSVPGTECSAYIQWITRQHRERTGASWRPGCDRAAATRSRPLSLATPRGGESRSYALRPGFSQRLRIAKVHSAGARAPARATQKTNANDPELELGLRPFGHALGRRERGLRARQAPCHAPDAR